MREYEVYLPMKQSDGREVDPGEIRKIKEQLAQEFGGYTEVTQRCEGVWQIGGVIFRDQITIVRVLDDGRAEVDMAAFRSALEQKLKQERVLIVVREVAAV
jgi:predicted amino acid-binding ACT domain protein